MTTEHLTLRISRPLRERIDNFSKKTHRTRTGGAITLLEEGLNQLEPTMALAAKRGARQGPRERAAKKAVTK